MRFSINPIGMYPGLPLADAFARMRSRGYDTFELWRIDPDNLPAIKAAMDQYGMRLSTMCVDEFILNDPSMRGAYEQGLRSAIEKAKSLGAKTLITQVGQDTGAPREAQRDSIIDGLRMMAPILESEDITLLVEPLNDVKDHVGYYLTDSNEGARIMREVDSPKVRLLYDIYHQVHMGEDVLKIIRENLDVIAHFHVAGHPARDERIFEQFDYRPVFDFLYQADTGAPVGLELFVDDPSKSDALLDELKGYCK